MTVPSIARYSCFLLPLSLCFCSPAAFAQNTKPKAASPAKTITLSNAILKWEATDSLPPSKEYRYPGETPPPYTLTLTALVEHTDAHNMLGNVFLISPDGDRLKGELLGKYTTDPGERKWMWSGDWVPDPRWKEWRFEFDTASEVGILTSVVEARKHLFEWSDIPVDGAIGSETPLGRAQTEKTGASGEKVWLESVKIKEGRQGASALLFGRWLPPATDPAMQFEIELGGDRRAGIPGASFDVGELTRTPMVAKGRQDGQSDSTPGWFTLPVTRPEGARRLSVKLKFDPSSPLTPPLRKPEIISLKVAAPNLPTATKTDRKPLAVQPLGKGELQLFPAELKPENGWKWSWRAPLFFVLPPGADDGTQWQDTGETFGNIVTGMRRRPMWKLDGTPLAPGELARDAFTNWSETPGKTPPTQSDLKIHWEHIKNDTFSPRFSKVPIPAPGVVLTPEISQPLGEWGTLVLKKVASFGPDETLSPSMKERAGTMLTLGGVALVFEQVPAAGKTDEWNLEMNYPNWAISLDEAHDSNAYPLLRVSDKPNGRRFPSRDELSTETGPANGERRITLYLLPPTPGAKTLDLTLSVAHRAVLERKDVIFPTVTLPAQ